MLERLDKKGIKVVLSGLNDDTKAVLGKAGLSERQHDYLYWAKNREEAEKLALSLCSVNQDS